MKLTTRIARAVRSTVRRAVLAVGLRLYAGAKIDRLLPGIASASDANREVATSLVTLRNRSREVRRDDGLAAGILDAVTQNMVGAGIRAKSIVYGARNDKERTDLEDEIDTLWDRWWAGDCDATGLNRPGATLLALAVGGWKESGGAIARRRWRRLTDNLAVPMQLQILEPDYIDLTADWPPDQYGYSWVQGIQFSKIGRVVAYRLYESHPGGSWSMPFSSLTVDVPASEIAYLTKPTRPGQVHGVPLITPVLASIIQRQRFIRSEMTRQETLAMLALIVTPPADSVDLSDDSIGVTLGVSEPADAEKPPIYETQLQAGGVYVARNGGTVTPVIPPGNSQYDVFCRRTDRDICCGSGVPYEIGTRDFSLVNYSSYVAGEIQWRESLRHDQRVWLEPLLLRRIYGWFIDAAVLAGKIKLRDGMSVGASWHFPALVDTNRAKSVDASLAAIAGGLSTWTAELSKEGLDFADVVAQRKKDDALIAAAGITFAAPATPVSPAKSAELDEPKKTPQSDA